LADSRAHFTSRALEGVPHAFCSGIGQKGAPSAAEICVNGQLVTVKQVHSARAIMVDGPFAEEARPEADALVTTQRGLVLGIVTADCAPVLLADKVAGVVGAAHAGWRGAHGGVLEASVALMQEAGAKLENITAAIGPTIAQQSYEVDDAFRANFGESDADLFIPGQPGHFQFDLEAYVARRLESCGISAIDPLGQDTYTGEHLFHSFRRATHRKQPTYGRQFSLICLPD